MTHGLVIIDKKYYETLRDHFNIFKVCFRCPYCEGITIETYNWKSVSDKEFILRSYAYESIYTRCSLCIRKNVKINKIAYSQARDATVQQPITLKGDIE